MLQPDVGLDHYMGDREIADTRDNMRLLQRFVELVVLLLQRGDGGIHIERLAANERDKLFGPPFAMKPVIGELQVGAIHSRTQAGSIGAIDLVGVGVGDINSQSLSCKTIMSI